MTFASESPEDAAWYALTGLQRRLVENYMAAMEDHLSQSDSLLDRPNALTLMFMFDVEPEDAMAAANWFARIDAEDRMRDRVNAILRTGEAQMGGSDGS